jgi:hypothetical protein
MKTWRERIMEARARGTFTRDDRRLAGPFGTCMVGECQERFGVSVMSLTLEPPYQSLTYAGAQFFSAVNRDDFDAAERIMEAMEDHALQLKRQA